MEKADKEKRNLYEGECRSVISRLSFLDDVLSDSASMKSSLRAPFRLEAILKIAQSQMDGNATRVAVISDRTQ